MANDIDISENELLQQSKEVLELLLKDHTTQKNIFWATNSYAVYGEGYTFFDAITIERITGEKGLMIRPRAAKSKGEQTERTKGMAEVFTPSWVCNAQNNLVDEAWFGRKDVFNIEDTDKHTWKSVVTPITFPEGKTWKDYVRATRIELSCGEAPYLASRYDTTTGTFIPLEQRIGMLDRKLRVISENTTSSGEWLEMAQEAYKNIYGFEWQGDNLLLAREALLVSFIEYYEAKFGKRPLEKSIKYIAYIISWNLWQMDGLKGVIPCSCKHNITEMGFDIYGQQEKRRITCNGCQKEIFKEHNGIYCLIKDWGSKDPNTGKSNQKIRFIDLIK